MHSNQMPTLAALSALALASACKREGFDDVSCRDLEAEDCVQVSADDPDGLIEALNGLAAGGAIVLGEGTFTMDNAVVIRGADGVTLIGQGMDATRLDFGGLKTQAPAGVDVIANDVRLEGFAVIDAPKDALRVEDSDGVVIRGIETTWSAGAATENGAYGIYPVKVSRVLLEDSVASYASDAGIYVGQCVNAVVRNNTASGNVAGLEIENTQFADVYGNTVTDNTGGLVVFDLPGNPVVGRDIWIHDNEVTDNNRANFAPGGTVRMIPAGTGTFSMASRRVIIEDNTYANNNTGDLAVLAGLVVQGDPEQWKLSKAELVGVVDGLDLEEDATGTSIYNWRTTDVVLRGNSHSGSGTAPDASLIDGAPGLGTLIALTWGDLAVDTVLYDAIGESAFDPVDPAGNSNDNRICIGADPGVTMASLDAENLSQAFPPTLDMVYRPAPPFAPFDCAGFGEVILPDLGDLDQTP